MKKFSIRYLLAWFLCKKASRLIPDETYAKMKYYSTFGRRLNIKNPTSFNEKLQWLKLYDRKEEYSKLVDKYEVKTYITEMLGDEYIIKTLGIWNSFEEIDFDILPNQFVLKCTHDSGGIVICKDKTCFDYYKAKKKLDKCMKRNYYSVSREWPYKNVTPRIMAEEYMVDESATELKDYKFFCFNGKVKCFKIDFDRFINHRANYYDMDLEQLKFGEVICPPDYGRKFEKPENFGTMIEKACLLSTGISFLRVDFYNINGKIYFGELTFYPSSGMGPFVPDSADKMLGDWLIISKK